MCKVSFLVVFVACCLSQVLGGHHICLLGLSGTASQTVLISRDMIESISKIDSYASFTVLTRDIQQANQSYSKFKHVSIYQGSMLNTSAIQQACHKADTAIFTSPEHPTLSPLEISTLILTGLELAKVKYFVYCPGNLNVPNTSFRNNDQLYKYLRQQVMDYRFKDYSIISTGNWMELFFPYETVSFLSTLPIFFGVSLPTSHHYTSMTDIGPITALVLYKIIYPGRYRISTYHREFEIYDPQPYTSTKLSTLLSSICQRHVWNFGAAIPHFLAALSPLFQIFQHERLTYLSSLFSHYLTHHNIPNSTKGYVNTVAILGYTPTTVDQYLKEILLGEKKITKISGAQARANEIRKEEINEGMKRRRKKKTDTDAETDNDNENEF